MPHALTLNSFLLALGVSVIWGVNFVIVKIGLNEIPPITLCVLRFFFVSIPLIFFIPKPKISWKYIISYGLITFALQFIFLFAGIAAGVAPGIAALITQSQVFFAIFFAYIFAHQRIGRWQIMGAIVSFSGIAVISLHHDGNCTLSGLILLLVGAVLWGLGNVISTRLRDINMLSLVIWSSFVAILPTFAAALIFESPLQIILHPQQLHGLSFLSLAYITLLSTHFGYTSWSWLCSRYPIAIITPFALLSPIIAVCCSSLLFHESFESWKVLAAFLVLMGLCINLFGQKLFDWSAALVTDSIDFFNTVFNRTDKQEESTFPSD